ncbi:hypothetical protein [Bacteroides neonati]|uniref:hypothetical protein n=1 Tax=Bacteroides neonati TaxID=1347393 RepID=UPI0005A8773C|nr:hypothetical protein [Bacteroides neonati]
MKIELEDDIPVYKIERQHLVALLREADNNTNVRTESDVDLNWTSRKTTGSIELQSVKVCDSSTKYVPPHPLCGRG